MISKTEPEKFEFFEWVSGNMVTDLEAILGKNCRGGDATVKLASLQKRYRRSGFQVRLEHRGFSVAYCTCSV